MRTVLLTRQVRRHRFRRKSVWLGSEPWCLLVYVGRSLFRLTAVGGCGYGIDARRGPDGVWVSVSDEWDLERTLVKRKRQGDAALPNVKHLAALESNVLGKLLPIIEHCAVTQYEDGTPRKPGWITVKTMGSSWVLEAKDPDSCSRLTVVQTTLDDALALLSVTLESEEAPWEPDPWLKKQQTEASKKK